MRPNRSQPTRSWPVRVASLLLLLQAGGLVTIHFLNLRRLDWTFIDLDTGAMVSAIPDANVAALSFAFLFVPSAVLAVLAAIGTLFLWRTGWLLAMLTQGLTLLVCLLSYFHERPAIIYPIMLYTVLMVLNLNSFEVRAAVHNRQEQNRQRREVQESREC
jgi:hypothetical protein